jgi:hypothetical protein
MLAAGGAMGEAARCGHPKPAAAATDGDGDARVHLAAQVAGRPIRARCEAHGGEGEALGGGAVGGGHGTTRPTRARAAAAAGAVRTGAVCAKGRAGGDGGGAGAGGVWATAAPQAAGRLRSPSPPALSAEHSSVRTTWKHWRSVAFEPRVSNSPAPCWPHQRSARCTRAV